MKPKPQARYTLASITTKDINLLTRRDNVKISGITDEEIFKKGIESIENEIAKIA